MTPVISVVMSVYNGGPFLQEAIESILNQTYNNFEFIIINDGSTDNSLKVIKDYASTDDRVICLSQENIGLTKSLNKGIHIAQGEYIARMDADDVSLAHRFETQLPWLEEKCYDFCCSRALSIEKNRITPRIKYYLPKRWLLKFSNPFIHGTYLIRKSVIDKIGGYDEEFRYSQDYKLIHDIFEKGYKVKYIKEPLYQSRKPPNSISVKNRKEQYEMGKKVYNSCFNSNSTILIIVWVVVIIVVYLFQFRNIFIKIMDLFGIPI